MTWNMMTQDWNSLSGLLIIQIIQDYSAFLQSEIRRLLYIIGAIMSLGGMYMVGGGSYQF